MTRYFRNFVRNSEAFKRVCDQTFDALDYRSCGKVSVNAAASCVESLFDELQGSCNEFGEQHQDKQSCMPRFHALIAH